MDLKTLNVQYERHDYPRFFTDIPEDVITGKNGNTSTTTQTFNPNSSHDVEELWCDIFSTYLLIPDRLLEEDIRKGTSIKKMSNSYQVEERVVYLRLALFYKDKMELPISLETIGVLCDRTYC